MRISPRPLPIPTLTTVTYIEVNKDQMWDDTLMMTVIPLAQIGILLNRPHYLEEAIYQFLIHIKFLEDTTTGLWFHGWEFTPEGKNSKGHNFARARWARGNSWITVSIPIFLEVMGDKLPESAKRHLVSSYRRQIDALVPLQDQATGLWHTLLDDPSSYVETSASAGFAAGILMGLRQGILSGEGYSRVARTALDGVIAQIAPDGEVSNVSFGTGMGRSLEFYHQIPITPMPYGQALAMLAVVEWERLNA